MRRDPLIIGAGPAGTAAAITLARAGGRPLLIERTTGAADKVCGDFLSADSISCARTLGVDPCALGAAPIRRIRLIHRERLAETALPFAAFGLSRRTLDAAMLRQAEHAGVVVRTGQAVRSVTRDAGHWMVETGGTVETRDRTALRTETVFLATGKHDLRAWPRWRPGRGAIGMKTYLALAAGSAQALEGAIELTLFPGGYAGLQCVENGRAVLCIAAQGRAFQKYGGSWRGLIAAIEQHSRRFASMLAGASMLLPRPVAIAGTPYGYQAGPVFPDGLFRLGDQAAVIPSLTGDGMAVALHSGQTAARIWLAGGDAAAYHHALNRTLVPQMRLAGLLHRVCLNGGVQSLAVQAAALWPALLRRAASHTRIPSPPDLPD